MELQQKLHDPFVHGPSFDKLSPRHPRGIDVYETCYDGEVDRSGDHKMQGYNNTVDHSHLFSDFPLIFWVTKVFFFLFWFFNGYQYMVQYLFVRIASRPSAGTWPPRRRKRSGGCCCQGPVTSMAWGMGREGKCGDLGA